jgi:hypothetical protein
VQNGGPIIFSKKATVPNYIYKKATVPNFISKTKRFRKEAPSSQIAIQKRGSRWVQL